MDHRGTEKIVRLEPTGREDDQLDKSGQAIIAMLDKAARAAKADDDRAVETAHELSLQLRDAEQRATRLQSEVDDLQQRVHQAEHWTVRIY